MEALAWVGIGLLILGGIGTMIAAFSTSVVWGIGCFLLWPVSLLFLVLHWDVAKYPFCVQLIGFALVLIGRSA